MSNPNTFLIFNSITGEVTVEAPNPEQIQHSFTYTDAHVKKRGPEQMIAEIPKVLGLNIYTFRNYPRAMLFDGVALYQKRKGNTNA